MFRNLAKMSRPKKGRKGDGDGSGKRVMKGVNRSEASLVEVVEGDDSEDLSRFMGEMFPYRKSGEALRDCCFWMSATLIK